MCCTRFVTYTAYTMVDQLFYQWFNLFLKLSLALHRPSLRFLFLSQYHDSRSVTAWVSCAILSSKILFAPYWLSYQTLPLPDSNNNDTYYYYYYWLLINLFFFLIIFSVILKSLRLAFFFYSFLFLWTYISSAYDFTVRLKVC